MCNLLTLFAQEFEKFGHIKGVPDGGVRREMFLRELKEPHRWLQTPAVFRMRGMFEIFLEMNERARGLDETLEEIGVARIRFQPKLLQDIVRFVIALFIPTTEEGAIK